METFTPRTDILPLAQQQLWPELRPVKTLGYVLYGGTAVALRLGHRQSVDFDFFTSRPVDRGELRQHLPFLREAEVTQDNGNTFEVITASGVKVSFSEASTSDGRASHRRRLMAFYSSRR
jgi:hypothetical protein